MPDATERRRHPRQACGRPRLVLLRLPQDTGDQPCHEQYADLEDLSLGGARVRLSMRLPDSLRLELSLYDQQARGWRELPARVAWVGDGDGQQDFLAGLELIPGARGRAPRRGAAAGGSPPQPRDLDFLTSNKLLRSIPPHAARPLLNRLRRRRLRCGQRLIRQGDPGDRVYIIQKGACDVLVEKDGALHAVATLKAGELVGEMAVITGEPRNAHVDAKTDLVLWELSKDDFEEVARRYPDLRAFLTELLTSRLDASLVCAERSLGRYLIKQKMGQGGWSIVYQGLHQGLNMPVAVKMLRHNLAMDAEFLEGFRREARIIAQMNHQNIVKVFDIEQRYQTIFIVMEYLEGRSLESLLRQQGALPLPLALDYLDQAVRGLDYAHGKGIVHQDIKPANLFVQPPGQIKILDFGLACPTGSDDLDLAGTAYYMAPEQINGKRVDARTDVYCLGIAAHEMILGRRPYAERDLTELLRAHLDQEIPDPAELRPDLPASVARFLVRACRRDPDERFQDMAQVRQALAGLRRQLGQTGPTPGDGQARSQALRLICPPGQWDALERALGEFSDQVKALGGQCLREPEADT